MSVPVRGMVTSVAESQIADCRDERAASSLTRFRWRPPDDALEMLCICARQQSGASAAHFTLRRSGHASVVAVSRRPSLAVTWSGPLCRIGCTTGTVCLRKPSRNYFGSLPRSASVLAVNGGLRIAVPNSPSSMRGKAALPIRRYCARNILDGATNTDPPNYVVPSAVWFTLI